MREKTPSRYLKMLRRTASHIRDSLISIGDIGTKHKKISFETLQFSSQEFGSTAMCSANYQAHFSLYHRLEDLISIGMPEYAIEELYKIGYLDLRNRRVTIPRDEELLTEALNAMKKKYVTRKVKELKERIRIKD